jgi:hypothetical protein
MPCISFTKRSVCGMKIQVFFSSDTIMMYLVINHKIVIFYKNRRKHFWMKQELMYQYKQLLFMKFWNWKRVILVIQIFDRDRRWPILQNTKYLVI